jgi:galactokinase
LSDLDPSIKTAYQNAFSREPEALTRASGRVNLIGEHTDYNGGFVLPSASRADGQSVRAISSNVRNGAEANFELGSERKQGGWSDYVQGVTFIARKAGLKISGFDCAIHSKVPMGSGLSSSAALEVSLFRALRETFSLDLDDVKIAKLSQQVENEFVGARVGIMDPMAASLAEVGSALFLDTENLKFEKVPVPSAIELIVINSGVKHSNVGSHQSGRDYNTRRSECEKACEILGIQSLRELHAWPREQALQKIESLPSPQKLRARHVFTENERVLETVRAMREGDLNRMGELFRASHLSMKNDYDVSVPEVDQLVEIACSQPEVFGARLTGGGFGGSIVALAKKGSALKVAPRIIAAYAEVTGKSASILVPEGKNSCT